MDLLRFAPLLAAVVVVGVVLLSILTLWVRHLHPLQLLTRSMSAASMLGILALAAILPPALWWGPWVLTLGLLGGVAVACRRLLTSDPPTEPTPRQAKHLVRPHLVNVVAEMFVYLALLVVAVTAG